MEALSCRAADFPLPQRDLLLLLGFRHIQTGNTSDALAIFEVLSVLLPNEIKITQSLIFTYLKVGRFNCALNELDKLADQSYLDPVTWLLRGQTLSRLGRTAESAKAMRMYIRLRNTRVLKENLLWK
ncbi:MAG: hypothetical protein LW714_03645 [Oxalobacteraceae bacterium]|jgi:type III secretion protein Y|nr:hypothetical protein [Oxalobacteraceae bacterium]